MNRRLLTIAGLVAVAGLVAGIGQLFLMRFSVGDIYPPYSTFRTDPLGARALHDSLAAIPGLTVERNVRPFEHLTAGRDTALLFLGDTVSARPNGDLLPAATVGWLNRFIRAGGRLVITLQPRGAAAARDDEESGGTNRVAGAAGTNAAVAATGTNAPARSGPDDGDDGESLPLVSLTGWLDASFGQMPVVGVATAAVTAAGRAAGLPEGLACHTTLCFTNAGAPWRVLYTRAGQPVVMERDFGAGTFALSTLSYVISNEALRDEREPAFVVWLVGGRTRVIFDETHHNLQESPGLMSMVRRYGLTWAVLNLLVLAALFVWRNNATLVPAGEAGGADGADVAAGKDSATALGNLLRRNVPPADLAATCVAVWKRSADHGSRLPPTVIRRIEAMVEAERLLPDRQRSPGRLYNDICGIVRKEGGKEPSWTATD